MIDAGGMMSCRLASRSDNLMRPTKFDYPGNIKGTLFQIGQTIP
jgi:hypothetical protein